METKKARMTTWSNDVISMNVISNAAISLRCEFNAQSIANLLRAHATIGRAELRLYFLSFVPTVATMMQDFQCQNLL